MPRRSRAPSRASSPPISRRTADELAVARDLHRRLPRAHRHTRPGHDLRHHALALPVKAGVGLAAGSLSERILLHPSAMTWMNRLSGGVLIALGLRLAATER